MRDVVLIHPPICFRKGESHVTLAEWPANGLIYIQSYIHKMSKDYRVHVLDCGGDIRTLDALQARLQEIKPWVVGIELLTPQLQGAVEVAQMIREKIDRKIPIFAGGHHMTADPGWVKRNADLFDHGIIAEGEIVFLESLDKLARGEELPRVQEGKPLEDLDIFPVADLYSFKRETYSRCQHIHGTRSCPYQCAFCSSPTDRHVGRMRFASNRRVIEEIKTNYDFYRGRIKFFDENFTLDRDRVMEFCHMVKQEALKINFFASTRIDLLDEEMLVEMKAAGLDVLACGLETGNEEFRNTAFNKGGRITNQQIHQVDEWCKKHKISFSAYFILGYPKETQQTIDETRKLIFDLTLEQVSLAMPSPFPGSALYEMAKADGVVNEDFMDRYARKEFGEGFWGVYPVYLSKELEMEHVASEIRDIYRKFYLNLKTFRKRVARLLVNPDDFLTDAKYFWGLITKGASFRRDFSGYDASYKLASPWQRLS